MLILIEPTGQTSNHFIQHVRLDSFCQENGICFFNMPMIKYLKNFPNIKLFSRSSFVAWLFFFVFRVLRKLTIVNYFDFNNPILSEEYSQKPEYFKGKLVFCSGWLLKQDDLFKKYQNQYRSELQPKVDELKLSSAYLKKEQDQMIVGIHIRRGDYAYYCNGQYLFDDQTYLNYLVQIKEMLGGKEMRVIIFTNDKDLDYKYYATHLGDVKISNQSVPEDYFLMSKCDYLIGTMSTFPLWVSYISGVKLFRFETKDQKFSLDNFKEVEVIY